MTVGLKVRKFEGKPDPWEPGIGNDEMLRRYVARYGVEPGFPARDPKTGEFRPLPGAFGFDPSRDRLSGAENTGFDKIALELAYKDGYAIPATIGRGLGGPGTDGRASTVEVIDLQFCGDFNWFSGFTAKYRKNFPATGGEAPVPEPIPPSTPPTVPHPIGTGPTEPNPNPPTPPPPVPPPSPNPETPAREVVEMVLLRLFELVPEWKDEAGVQMGVGKRSAARKFLFFAQKELLK